MIGLCYHAIDTGAMEANWGERVDSGGEIKRMYRLPSGENRGHHRGPSLKNLASPAPRMSTCWKLPKWRRCL